MSEFARLLLPAIRWDKSNGYESSRELIDLAFGLGVGGFIIFGGESDAVRTLTADLRSRSSVPLLIGADLERGAGQQFAGAIGLPPLAAIGSLGDNDAVRGAGALTARDAKLLGINWIYAPVCDIDIEPENPIVGTRSLGSDPHEVAIAVAEWIGGCQSVTVLACAKHFPGHGRTTADSHAELPTVNVSADVLAETDLVPFKSAIDSRVAGVMTAHVAFPALDPSGVPATLSRAILHDLLRDKLGFPGLVVTDALIMEAVLGGGETAAIVKALAAGCDLLLYPTDLRGCAEAIDAAVERGELDRTRLEKSLERRNEWAEWASGDHKPVTVTRDDTIWAEELAERVVHKVRGEPSTLSGSAEVIVVDDDVGGPYPPPSRLPFTNTLAELGLQTDLREAPSGNPDTHVVVALFGDIRSWKGRPGYSVHAIDAVATALEVARSSRQSPTIVQFSHPRLATSIPGDAPVLCAWGGEAVMQRAAARVLAGVPAREASLREAGAGR